MSSASVLLEYERVWSDGMNRGDVSVADRAFHPDCIFHFTGVAEPMRGVEAWKTFVAAFLAAFPDLHLIVDEQIVDGDRVATRWHGSGTHRGALGPVPPTSRTIAISGLIVDHLRGDKPIERWEQMDQALLMQQLGLG